VKTEVLQQAHDELKQRVAERTEELRRVKEELRTEITRRQRMEDTVRESEMHLRDLAANIPGAVYQFLIHPDGSQAVSYMSASGESLFERPLADLTNSALLFDDVHPDDLASFRQSIVEAAQRMERWTLEFRIVKSGGRIKWLRGSSNPRRLPDGSILWNGVLLDITERRRAEEELELRNEELIHFMYTVSHDLKSPVVTIRTFLGYLEQDIQNQEAARVAKDLDYMRTAADKMSRLLEDLLELSRIGHKVNPSGEAPLQAIVNEALALVAGRIAQRGAQVQVTVEPIGLYGDRPRLVQVFQNLVDNAVQFMGDQPAPRVEIGVEQDRDKIVLFVRDNGIGIDPRHQPKLFGLFEKLDPASEGTGIGLALARRIVEAHGGRIWVESEGLGKGATFRFTLATVAAGILPAVAGGILPPGLSNRTPEP